MIDVGCNLTCEQFHGLYHGRRAHDDDFELVLQRAWHVGLKSIFVTAGMFLSLLSTSFYACYAV